MKPWTMDVTPQPQDRQRYVNLTRATSAHRRAWWAESRRHQERLGLEPDERSLVAARGAELEAAINALWAALPSATEATEVAAKIEMITSYQARPPCAALAHLLPMLEAALAADTLRLGIHGEPELPQ